MGNLLDGLLRSADFSLADGAVNYFIVRTSSSASRSNLILADRICGGMIGIHRHFNGLTLSVRICGGDGVFARQKDILVIFIWHQLFAIFRHGLSTSHCKVDLATVSLAVFNANKCDLRRQHGIVLTLIEFKLVPRLFQSLVQ